ncbi:hypothetical protein AB1Y20_005781 [Prymnesium parvum]|uniref:Hexosyltransferase n=1 Tax=Prymnesium parvum TaxID=97485 RepID=A0AB34J2U0_PRYPA
MDHLFDATTPSCAPGRPLLNGSHQEGAFWRGNSNAALPNRTQWQLLRQRRGLVFALYGRAHSNELPAWEQTWLRGRPYVFIPDAPAGPHAAFYKPLQLGSAGRDHIANTPADANMIWAVILANLSFPDARWVFVVDSDTFVFPAAIWDVAQQYDSTEAHLIGATGFSQTYSCAPCARHIARNRSSSRAIKGQQTRSQSCRCFCPVCVQQGQAGPQYVLDTERGTAHYEQHPVFAYGGHGILLSRGLLDRLPHEYFSRCARRLICGASDQRLRQCIQHLQPHLKNTNANRKFFLAANLSFKEAGMARGSSPDLDRSNHTRQRVLDVFAERRILSVEHT